jgi:acetyl-CoA synthetase
MPSTGLIQAAFVGLVQLPVQVRARGFDVPGKQRRCFPCNQRVLRFRTVHRQRGIIRELRACAHRVERSRATTSLMPPQEVDAALASTLRASGVSASPEYLRNSAFHIPDYETYCEMYTRSLRDPTGFWLEMARNNFYWRDPNAITPDSVYRYNFDVRQGPIQVEWFFRAETNICYNALDRHVEQGLGNRVALYYEANDMDDMDTHRAITYAELLDMVKRIARVLRRQGVRRGDTVTIYMPMVPELPAAMLACARIGAVHNVVFGGFSAEALAGRLLDARSAVILSCDGIRRGPKRIELKATVDEAIEICQKRDPSFHVSCQLVLRRLGESMLPSLTMQAGRDVDLRVAMEEAVSGPDDAIEWMKAEDPLFLLYTSGSTGTPKGVLHTTGGYMVNAALTFKYSFNYQPGDVYFCTADCGWITGHSYVVYGPMLNAATQVLFEGVPTWPDPGRLWAIVDKYQVTHLYTAPTAIRSLKKAGDEYVKRYKRTSLKILATVGEPINPQVWEWYHQVVGDSRCNVVDTYWQTETGAHVVISPPVRGFPQKPGSAGVPFFGIRLAVLDDRGKEIPFVPGQESEGYLCIRDPWPSCLRTIFGAQARFENGYFKPFPGYYMTGDGCRRDGDGYIWITGRVDDVINVSGHRIGTAEVESALVRHPAVAEAAVVGMPHEIKGECIACFVILADGYTPSDTLRNELVQTCRKEIGAFAAPERIIWTPALPKTRSGKIMRRILRKISEQGRDLDRSVLGDLSTLADPSAVDAVIQSFLS